MRPPIRVGARVRWAAIPGSSTSVIRSGVVLYVGGATAHVRVETTSGVCQARVIGSTDRVMIARLHPEDTSADDIMSAESRLFR